MALLVERYRSKGTIVLERSTYIVQAIPGIVVALSFVYLTNRYLFQLYQSSIELILAYAIMFFPLALVAVRAGVAQTPPGLEELARSLGHRRASVFFRVTLPILAPALAAGFALVFISSSTELTATLILHPTEVQTLATGFWAYQNDFAYGAAAPYALALLLVATLPGLLLGPLVRAGRGGRTMSTAHSLSIADVRKSFGARTVLDGVSLEVAAGSLTAILGASGSGKTTLLRLLAGFDRADSGTISLGGQVVDGPRAFVAPERRRIGYVPQDGALFPHLSVGRTSRSGCATGRRPARAWPSCSSWSGSPASRSGCRTTSPAASASASRSRGRWRRVRRSCCSTSRSRRSTSSCARACGVRWSRFCSARVRRRSW